MSRALKRPMFRRGGPANDGIMSGITDRKKLREGTLDTDLARTQARDIISIMDELSPVRKTRLPLGTIGIALAQGAPLVDALGAGYTDFVKRDDVRRALLDKRKQAAVSTAIGSQLSKKNQNILTNRKKAMVNIKAQGLPLTEENIIKETARLNKIDETGKSLSPDRVLAGRESLYLQSYGDGSKARNHAVFDINVAPEIRKAGKNPRGRIKFKDGKYVTKRKMPGVYIDVDNGKVIEITPELEAVELTEFSALLR